jgi:DNA-binding NtrC family response regulator
MEHSILLVDDEPDIRDVLAIYLTDLGYTVHTAENGETALQTFHRVVPSMVLSDIKMPGMNGIELLRRIKAEAPTTEVIMITGHGDMALAIDSLKLEATDFITKPINDDMLAVALRRAEERITMRRQLKAYTENLEQIAE